MNTINRSKKGHLHHYVDGDLRAQVAADHADEYLANLHAQGVDVDAAIAEVDALPQVYGLPPLP